MSRSFPLIQRCILQEGGIVLQNEESGSVEYSSYAYAEADPGPAFPLTQSRFASSNRLFGTVLGTVRMGHDSRLAHNRLHRCAAHLKQAHCQNKEQDAHIDLPKNVDVHLIEPLFFQRIVKEKLIYNTNRFVLQECVIILGECLTGKNQWELLTGDDVVDLFHLLILKL